MPDFERISADELRSELADALGGDWSFAEIGSAGVIARNPVCCKVLTGRPEYPPCSRLG